MPRAKFQTLTEQMFYILLCLREECYGMDILDQVPSMTQGRVNVGSGTLYNLLEQFCQAGMIRDQEAWLSALAARNNVTHAYNQALALEIVRLTRETYLDMFRALKADLEQNWISML